MEKYVFFIGIDISKLHLDFCLRDAHGRLLDVRVANSADGIKEALRAMRKCADLGPGNSLFCMEHTGIYGMVALCGLHAGGFTVWHEAAASIRNGAGGIWRGKDDKVDAGRIADYAYTFRAKARPWEPPRKVVTQLSDLMALRGRLTDVVQKLKVPAGELKGFRGKAEAAEVRQAGSRTLAAARKDLAAVNKRIMALLKGDPALARLFSIITSVRGVGFVTATALIIATNEFKAISDPRKLACHAGCAPFDHRSGTSVRGRSRVSHKANKRLKQLLHLCACSVIRLPGELQDYFLRKVSQGKSKYVALNAIRNKIIHRICACVRDGRMYLGIPA